MLTYIRFLRGLAVLAALSLAGYVLASVIAFSPVGQAIPGINNVFYRLYGLHEGPFFLLLGLFAAVAGLSLMRAWQPDVRGRSWNVGTRAIVGLALVVILIGWAGHRTVMHSFALSMDEYNAEFQSEIFAKDELGVPVPPEWRPFVRAATPGYVTFVPEQQAWVSGYLPVYAALRAIGLRLHIASLLNPIFAGLSVLLIAAVARLLWPGSAASPAIAAILLACSCQFLFMSMTSYSMPAHLLFNLAWLFLYLKLDHTPRKWPLLVLPWVGVLATGLHNPFPHLLFVAPFVVTILRVKRFGLFAYVGAVYLTGAAVWLAWTHAAVPATVQSFALSIFGIPGALQLLTELMSFSLIASWQTPALVLGLLALLLARRRLGHVERDLVTGVVLSLGFYFFYLRSQGHGWGYRYSYNVLGNLALLATAGVTSVVQTFGRARVTSLLLASIACSVAIQVPLRAIQVNRFVRPFASAMHALKGADYRAVVVPADQIWYGMDLIRNIPYGSGPVLLAGSGSVSDEQRATLRRVFGARVWYPRPQDLEVFGLVVRSAE
jgi:hypothetical protein